MSIAKFYIYRHIRPDTNEVFYIGKGNNLNGRRYARSRDKKGRNKIWNSIVNRNNGNYIIEIMYECDSDSECSKKELEFVSLYGRIDLKTGTLANLTDGGEGTLNPSVEARQKIGARQKGGNSHYAVKVINTSNGIIYDCVDDAAKDNDLPKWGFYKMLNKERPNKTTLIYLADYEKGNWGGLINQEQKKGIKPDWNKIIDKATGKVYECMMDAAREFSICKSDLMRMLRGYYFSRGKKYIKKNTTTLEYYGKSL